MRRGSETFPTFQKHPHLNHIIKSEVHPGKEAGALHPKDRDEDVGDRDEEDDNGCYVVQAVQALVVGLVIDVPPSCNEHMHTHQ